MISTSHNGSQVQSERLYPFLLKMYSEEFIRNICLIKTDTEGHDHIILEDLHTALRPRFIWTEWFAGYKNGSPGHCTRRSKKLFQTIEGLGYQAYEPRLPLRRIKSCKNEDYEKDLLLIKNA